MHSLNGYSYKYTHPSDEVLGHFINLSNLPDLILRMGHPITSLSQLPFFNHPNFLPFIKNNFA